MNAGQDRGRTSARDWRRAHGPKEGLYPRFWPRSRAKEPAEGPLMWHITEKQVGLAGGCLPLRPPPCAPFSVALLPVPVLPRASFCHGLFPQRSGQPGDALPLPHVRAGLLPHVPHLCGLRLGRYLGRTPALRPHLGRRNSSTPTLTRQDYPSSAFPSVFQV